MAELYIDGYPALPSRFQIGDPVRVAHGNPHFTVRVTGVCFRAGKVFYEISGLMYESHEVHAPLKLVTVTEV